MDELRYEIRKLINDQAESMLLDLVWYLEHGEADTLEDCEEVIDDRSVDECLTLSLDDRLALVEEYGEEYGFSFKGVGISGIRQTLEGYACAIVHFLAQAEARSALEQLQAFLDDEELELSSVVPENRYATFRHYGERQIGEVQVYEYRNVEGIHVDVFEFPLFGEAKLFLERRLEATDVSLEERGFDAV